MKYSNAQIKAIRFYQGDVSGTDPFWGDEKAYCTLNALFFPGIDNEIARCREGKKLNPAFLEDADRLSSLCCDLISAFFVSPAADTMLTWRVERLSDYKIRRDSKNTVSFTSTSKAGFLADYSDKKGLALMCFEIPEGTPCIDMDAALEYYKKSSEAEVLLPPGLELSFADIPLDSGMNAIRDADGMPPRVACIVKPCGIKGSFESTADISIGGMTAGQRVFAALNAGSSPDKTDVLSYTAWKSAFQNYIFRHLR